MSQIEVRVDSERFLELAQKSALIEPGDFRETVAALKDPVTGKVPDDPRILAEEFVKRDLVTRWQADNLLRGKYKGFMLGRYQLRGLLGSGGMSSVYLAKHTLLRRLVAIKVLPPSKVNDSSYLARFHREGEAIAQLNHKNIVRAYDIDQDGKTHYFVMEYVDGPDFMKLILEKGPLDFQTAAEYIAQAADGLQHAHEVGFIHRDIKPGNLLIDSQNVVKVLDLGLTLFQEEDGPSLTLAHNENVLGTADFLSPEQALNSHNVDTRADIYSLGCTFYFLLTGHAPFPKGSISERLIKHQKETAPPIRDDRSDCPEELEVICAKMMRKSRKQRFQTCAEVSQALRDWLYGKKRYKSSLAVEVEETEKPRKVQKPEVLAIVAQLNSAKKASAKPAIAIAKDEPELTFGPDSSDISISGAPGAAKSSQATATKPTSARSRAGSETLRGTETSKIVSSPVMQPREASWDELLQVDPNAVQVPKGYRPKKNSSMVFIFGAVIGLVSIIAMVFALILRD